MERFDIATLRQALIDEFGDRVAFVEKPTEKQLKEAEIVLLSTGTYDSEGWDRPFALYPEEEHCVQLSTRLNPRTVVIVNSGGGVRMTAWNADAAAIVYGWYPGQIGNRALAEVLSGKTNPSGKLPITLERRFEDTPGCGYIPFDDQLYVGLSDHNVQMTRPNHPVEYKEGVFVGYRWFDARETAPLYAFGHGLSYTSFSYANPRVTTPTSESGSNSVEVTCTVKNEGRVAGTEVVQVYVHPARSPVAQPLKELEAFARVTFAPGESRDVTISLARHHFAYWDVTTHD